MDQNILKRAIEHFGVEVQTNKLQEEALELSLVLNQIKCPTKDYAEMEYKLYDELADMTIMMGQANLIFDAERIKERVSYKLHRLEMKYLNGKKS